MRPRDLLHRVRRPAATDTASMYSCCCCTPHPPPTPPPRRACLAPPFLTPVSSSLLIIPIIDLPSLAPPASKSCYHHRHWPFRDPPGKPPPNPIPPSQAAPQTGPLHAYTTLPLHLPTHARSSHYHHPPLISFGLFLCPPPSSRSLDLDFFSIHCRIIPSLEDKKQPPPLRCSNYVSDCE